MKVVLLRHTPDPDKTVALSARLCYSPVGVAELQEKMKDLLLDDKLEEALEELNVAKYIHGVSAKELSGLIR